MKKSSLYSKKIETNLKKDIIDDKQKGVFNKFINRRLKGSIFNNNGKSISNSNDDDYKEKSKLSRKSITIKNQLEHNRSFFEKRVSNQLPSDKLNQLCNQCLILLRQNKISTKNAFDIILIDHLNDIVNVENTTDNNAKIKFTENQQDLSKLNFNKNELDINYEIIKDNNFEKFQRAAVTLEASARIYGYRVDSTFDNAYKILSNIKNGQILLNDDNFNENEYENSDNENNISLIKKDISNKKLNRKKIIFSDDNNTIVDNHDLITIKDFERNKEITEKSYFVKFLENEMRLNKIRFGVESNNIGSISSMLINNLELKELFDGNQNSISILFNISGKNKINDTNLKRKLKNNQFKLLKVNQITLDILLSNINNNNNNNNISNELKKILDSIEEINIKYKNNSKVNNSIIIQYIDDDEYTQLFSKKKYISSFENISNNNIDQINSEYNENNLDMETNNNFIKFQQHIDKVFEQYHFNNNFQSQEMKQNKKQDLNSSSLSDIIDYLVINSKKNTNYQVEIKNNTKSNKKSNNKFKNNQINLINFEFLSNIINNHIFDGIQWIQELPRNHLIQDNINKSKSRSQTSKLFVDQHNTTSIFNYNLNHLFCLANLTGRKINLSSIHNKNNDTYSNDLFINFQNDSSQDSCNEYQFQDIDLMLNHDKIEKIIQTENNLFDQHSIDDKLIITPNKQVHFFDKNDLLEKTSRSLFIANNHNSILKFYKSSNHIDIDIIKKYIKNSIHSLYSKNQILTLSNIIHQSVSFSFLILIFDILTYLKFIIKYFNNIFDMFLIIRKNYFRILIFIQFLLEFSSFVFYIFVMRKITL